MLDSSRLTRRHFLHMLGAVGGSGAVCHGLSAMGLLGNLEARAEVPAFPHNVGEGRKVIVLGAGIAGLCAAYNLTQAGFEVKVLEANDRYGGRVFTVRTGDQYRETNEINQTCTFDEGLYFDLGAGRIPSHHATVLDYCRRFGVSVEPYVFMSQSNLLQSDNFNDGEPVQLRRLDAQIRGKIAEMLANISDPQVLDQYLGDADRESFLSMLEQFGDLDRLKKGKLKYHGSDRSGFAIPPGGNRSVSARWPELQFDEILKSRLWDQRLFNSLQVYWQSTLVQPRGGMDMVWRGFLRQSVPRGGKLKDLVKLNARATRVTNTAKGVVVEYNGRTERADFCVSTMAPALLGSLKTNFSKRFTDALKSSDLVPACKVGWQAKWRFWEKNDEIYGGISWTNHIINQMWYPSSGFFGSTGVLTGAYNRGQEAEQFGSLSHDERLNVALEGGERLHPGFSEWVYVNRGLTIAWQNMPNIRGGWTEDLYSTKPTIYRTLNTAEGNVFLAGDFLSRLSGWQEGAMLSAHQAVNHIVARVQGRHSKSGNVDTQRAEDCLCEARP